MSRRPSFPSFPSMRSRRGAGASRMTLSLALAVALPLLAGGCAPAVQVPPPAPTPTLAELMRRPAERALLEKKGALPLRLGGRVLRAETAVIVGLTVLQYALGDLADGR